MKLADMLQNRHPMSQTVRDGSLAAIAGMGLQPRLGLYPQSAFPRRGHDQADRGKGRQPSAAGHRRHQAGRHQPGQHHRQHGGAAGGHRVCQGRGHAPADCRRGVAKNLAGRRTFPRALFKVLETQNIIEGEAAITLIPKNAALLGQLVASSQSAKAEAGVKPAPAK